MTQNLPQIHLAAIGALLFAMGMVGTILTTSPSLLIDQNVRKSSPKSGLEVVPGTQIPSTSSASQLQGAQPVQNVRSTNLQQSAQTESLQPNAKTDSFKPVESVQ